MNIERWSGPLLAVALLGPVLTTAACAPGVGQSLMLQSATDVAFETRDQGSSGVLFQKELQHARKLPAYRTADRESFEAALAYYDGGRYPIPFGMYFLTRLVLEVRDLGLTEIELETSDLFCKASRPIAPHQLCSFTGRLVFKKNGTAGVKQFTIEKYDVGGTNTLSQVRVDQIRKFVAIAAKRIADSLDS